MKFYLRPTLALCLFPTLLLAQGQALLWRITTPNGKATSHLFGTMHLIPEERYLFTPAMVDALKKSGTLVLETDLDIPLGKQLELAQKMMIPEGKSLTDLMSTAEYAHLKAVMVDSLGIKESKFTKQYGRIMPVFLSGLLLTELLDKVKMYEQELSTLAKKQKLKVIGLETIDEQMAIMESYPLDAQVNDLKKTDPSMVREFHALVDAYVAQDLDRMVKLSEEDPSMADIEEKFLAERNRNWMPRIMELCQAGPTFFAVGALHLAGPNGLILALRSQGYTVEPVN